MHENENQNDGSEWIAVDPASLPHPDHVVMLLNTNKTDGNNRKYLRLGHTQLNAKLGDFWYVYGDGAQSLTTFTHWRHA